MGQDLTADELDKLAHLLGELRRWGLRLQERQGTKIAVVGVARKLAVLMLHLWQTGASYERLHLQGETATATDVVSPTTV